MPMVFVFQPIEIEYLEKRIVIEVMDRCFGHHAACHAVLRLLGRRIADGNGRSCAELGTNTIIPRQFNK